MFSPEQYRALREGAGVLDRSDRGRLILTGADRRTYLQGLLTNDIAALTAGTGCYAALLTPQGRMIADMRVLELGDAVSIDLPAPVAATVRDRLDQFIFSEDVQVVDVTTARGQVGVYGPMSAAVLARVLESSQDQQRIAELDALPVYANIRRYSPDAAIVVVRSDDPGVLGFDVFIYAERAAELVDAFQRAGATIVSPETAEVCRIESGRPAFGVDMDEDTIPLEAGIEDRAISLTKGCYVGQEIIIRVLHRGHGRVARRLVGLTLDSDATPPARGAAIRSGDRDIGHVTSAAASPAVGRAIALGYVHRDFVAPGAAVTVASDSTEHRAVVTALPFAGV